MPAGRPRKPTALHVLHGNPGKRKLPKEPKTTRGVPKMPDGLSDRAVGAWESIAPVLDDMGVLTLSDGPALAMLVEAYAEFWEARKVVQEEGMTYETESENGSVMKRALPEVAIAADAFRRVASMLSRFGLTPADRAKVTPADAGDEDPFSDFMGRGRPKQA